MPSTLDFSHLPAELKEFVSGGGPAPANTPIEALGLTREGTALLTERASRLTKGDLEDLRKGFIDAQERLGLSVDDINSVAAAFSQPIQIGLGATKDFSCCCTPCCCAAALPVVQAVC